MELRYDFKERCFYCVASYDERDIPKQAGFAWDNFKKRWHTTNVQKAETVKQYADASALKRINACKEISQITDDQKHHILNALKQVSGRCDYAESDDNVGFNKPDSKFGKSVARLIKLTDNQAYRAKKILRKYRKQIDSITFKAIYS